METVKKQNKKPGKVKNQPPLVVKVRTARGNIVSMKQITPSELNALRNKAYNYLA